MLVIIRQKKIIQHWTSQNHNQSKSKKKPQIPTFKMSTLKTMIVMATSLSAAFAEQVAEGGSAIAEERKEMEQPAAGGAAAVPGHKGAPPYMSIAERMKKMRERRDTLGGKKPGVERREEMEVKKPRGKKPRGKKPRGKHPRGKHPKGKRAHKKKHGGDDAEDTVQN